MRRGNSRSESSNHPALPVLRMQGGRRGLLSGCCHVPPLGLVKDLKEVAPKVCCDEDTQGVALERKRKKEEMPVLKKEAAARIAKEEEAKLKEQEKEALKKAKEEEQGEEEAGSGEGGEEGGQDSEKKGLGGEVNRNAVTIELAKSGR